MTDEKDYKDYTEKEKEDIIKGAKNSTQNKIKEWVDKNYYKSIFKDWWVKKWKSKTIVKV